MTSAPPVFEVEGVTVRVAGRLVVADASFALVAGERLALMGPSGGGKTTLLRAAVGLAERASGTVRHRGVPVADHAWPGVRRAVVWVAQRPAFGPGSVRDALAAPFAYRAASGPFDGAAAAALLDRLGIGADRQGDPVARLSEGQQKRVALARAVLLAPDVLLLDEPTSGLDPAGIERVEALLVALAAERGLACAVVTHDAAQAARLCQRTLDLAPHLRGSPS